MYSVFLEKQVIHMGGIFHSFSELSIGWNSTRVDLICGRQGCSCVLCCQPEEGLSCWCLFSSTGDDLFLIGKGTNEEHQIKIAVSMEWITHLIFSIVDDHVPMARGN